MSLCDSGASSARAAFIHPARQRGPPPSAWKWEPAHISLEWTDLPPLPVIRDGRARCHDQELPRAHGWLRPKQFSYADEIGCYRRLEWLGDAALHPAYAKHLYRLFPEAGSGVLSVWPGPVRFSRLGNRR